MVFKDIDIREVADVALPISNRSGDEEASAISATIEWVRGPISLYSQDTP